MMRNDSSSALNFVFLINNCIFDMSIRNKWKLIKYKFKIYDKFKI